MPPTQETLSDSEIEKRLSSRFPDWTWSKSGHRLGTWIWDRGFDIARVGDSKGKHRWVCKECIIRGPRSGRVGAFCENSRWSIMNHLVLIHGVRTTAGQMKGDGNVKAKVGPEAQFPRNTGEQRICPPDLDPNHIDVEEEEEEEAEVANATERFDRAADTASPATSLSITPDSSSVASTPAFIKEEEAEDNDIAYGGIDWDQLPGFSIPRCHTQRARSGWVWDHGFDIENIGSGNQFWLCKVCHENKAAITHMYDAASISQASGHMEEIHRIDKDGPMPPPKKQRTLHDMLGLDPHSSGDRDVVSPPMKKQRTLEALDRDPHSLGEPDQNVASFDAAHFQQLLIRWMACDNIPFHMLESPYFRGLMGYANSAILDSGGLPTRNTIRECVTRSFNHHKGVVKEILSRSLSRIHVSLNVWSPHGFDSLLSLSVHFLDDQGKLRTFLLGLPQIESRNSNETSTDRVRKIIREYEIEDRIGFVVTDIHLFLDVDIDLQRIRSSFEGDNYPVHCYSEVIGRVAHAIHFGGKSAIFKDPRSKETFRDSEEIQRTVRADGGPIGKLHNIVHWVHESDERVKKLHELQSIEHSAAGLEDETTYDVVLSDGRRWNSYEAMMQRGYKLRYALDSLVATKVKWWNEYQARPRKATCFDRFRKSRPAILDDEMSTEDWLVIADYLAILKPLKIAMNRLAGRPQEGKFGAVWEVLPIMKWLLNHLGEAKQRHERGEEKEYPWFDCDYGFKMLNEHLTSTENQVPYVAALVLHPAFRWKAVESQWADQPDWLGRNMAAVQELWRKYQTNPTEPDAPSEQSTIHRKTTEVMELDDFITSIRRSSTTRPPPPRTGEDEYAKWTATTDPDDHLVDNPIQYWLLKRRQYPQLSKMAMDIFSLPAMFSADPERVFSLAEQMVTSEGGRLDLNFIEAFHCTSSWAKNGAIQISE